MVSIKTTIMSNVTKFVIGKEFEEKAPMSGKIQKIVASLEGDNLVLTGQTEIGEVRRTFVFTDDGMILNMHAVDKDA